MAGAAGPPSTQAALASYIGLSMTLHQIVCPYTHPPTPAGIYPSSIALICKAMYFE
jgi:hypothetical protein